MSNEASAKATPHDASEKRSEKKEESKARPGRVVRRQETLVVQPKPNG